jgi:hypothetical protein
MFSYYVRILPCIRTKYAENNYTHIGQEDSAVNGRKTRTCQMDEILQKTEIQNGCQEAV